MTLLTIFGGKELDDWSGKRTVKTGQIKRTLTPNDGSIGSDKALPSSPAAPAAFLRPNVTSSSQEAAAAGAKATSCDSSTDASTDDNSTIALNDGRVGEQDPQVVQSDSEDHEDCDGDLLLEDGETLTLDEYSLEEGYGGGCIGCSDINIEISPEHVDSEALNYWRRVKANRSRSRASAPRHRRSQSWAAESQASTSSIKHNSVEGFDYTQIEVVHDETHKIREESGVKLEAQAAKSKSFLRKVKKLSSKSQRALMSKVEKAVTAATAVVASDKNNRCQEGESSPTEATLHDTDSSLGCEVEFKPKLQRQTSSAKLVEVLSKGKTMVMSKMQQKSARFNNHSRHSVDISCASSTEDPFGDYVDKYKTQDEEEVSASAYGHELVEEEEMEQALRGLETSAYDGTSSTLEVGNSTIKARAMRSRGSILRIAKSMKFNSAAFSDSSNANQSASGSVSANTSATSNVGEDKAIGSVKKRDMRSALLFAASKTASLKNLGKNIKEGVVRLRKISTRRSLKGPDLVVCIDGKGDRLNPSEAMPVKLNVENDVQGCHSSDGDEPTVGSATKVVVEVDGPVLTQMCLMRSTFEPVDFEGDENSLCSTISGMHTVNTDHTGWFLTAGEELVDAGADDEAAEIRKSQSSLTRFGIETPFIEMPPELLLSSSSPGSTSWRSDDDYRASDSESESTQDELNSLSTSSSVDESILYELFPSSSFSSLTGIKCHSMGCANAAEDKAPEPTTIEVDLNQGRYRVRSDKRRASRQTCAANDSDKAPVARCDDDKDSIIESGE